MEKVTGVYLYLLVAGSRPAFFHRYFSHTPHWDYIMFYGISISSVLNHVDNAASTYSAE